MKATAVSECPTSPFLLGWYRIKFVQFFSFFSREKKTEIMPVPSCPGLLRFFVFLQIQEVSERIHSFTTPRINTGQHMKHLLRSAVMVLNNSTSLESGSAKKNTSWQRIRLLLYNSRRKERNQERRGKEMKGP